MENGANKQTIHEKRSRKSKNQAEIKWTEKCNVYSMKEMSQKHMYFIIIIFFFINIQWWWKGATKTDWK